MSFTEDDENDQSEDKNDPSVPRSAVSNPPKLCALGIHPLSTPTARPKRTGKAIVPGIGTGKGRKESSWCLKSDDELEDEDVDVDVDESEERDKTFKRPRQRVRQRKAGDYQDI